MSARPKGILAILSLLLTPGTALCGSPDLQQTTSERARQSGYVLGPDDRISVHVVDAEELSDKPVRIDLNGYIRLPLVGWVQAAGKTVEQLEADFVTLLKPFVLKPDVSISITEFHSQPVSVIGCVKNPGIQQLQGRKTLVEMLSLAGGLTTDAGPVVKITRRVEWGRIPLSGAADSTNGQYSIADIKLANILSANNPEENIVVRPNDVISVPRAEMIYVTGQVVRSGGFVLNERESISVLQALALAGGLDRFASPQNSRILRPAPGSSSRAEIAVDLRKIISGQGEDLLLKPDDILFVPSSAPKKAALRAVEAAIQLGTGIVIWRR
jgi:polysaccharide export outer membrane protein